MVNRHGKDAQHHDPSGNANQNHSESNISYLSERPLPKRQQITSVGKDVKKRELLCTVGGNVNWYNHYRKEYSS